MVVPLALDLLRDRQRHWSLPQPFYTSREIFDLDMEHIFGRSWLFVALSCEVKRPGDWITVELGHESLIVVRGNDGDIRAFHNSCRHRGSRICLTDDGRSKRFTCPYHQWSYDLTGELVGTRHMEGDFDKSEFGLAPVHCQNLAGYIFISLGAIPPPFDAMRRDLEPFIAAQDIDNCKVIHSQTLLEQANWKLVLENNRECYHCVGTHRELLRTLAEFDDPRDPRMDPTFAALIHHKNAEWAAQGVAHNPTPPNIQYRAVRLPLIDGAVSMTMDGKLGCTKLMGNFTDPDLGSVRMLSLPNSWNHLMADHMMAFRVLPKGPTETLVTTKWLVHGDAVEGVDYHVDRLTHVWRETNVQDKVLDEHNQLGINSMAYRPGPYSAQIEMGVRDFVDWYAGELELRLSEVTG